MRRNPIYLFKNRDSIGIYTVPVESIVQIIDGGDGIPLLTQLSDKLGFAPNTTIGEYLDSGSYVPLDKDTLYDDSDLTDRVTINETIISDNSFDIATNANDITTVVDITDVNTTDIATNTSDIVIVSDAVIANTANITTNTSGVESNTTGIVDLSSRTDILEETVDINTPVIITNTSAIAALDTRVGITEITSTSNTTILDTLEPRVSAVETTSANNIADIETANIGIGNNVTNITANTNAIIDIQQGTPVVNATGADATTNAATINEILVVLRAAGITI